MATTTTNQTQGSTITPPPMDFNLGKKPKNIEERLDEMGKASISTNFGGTAQPQTTSPASNNEGAGNQVAPSDEDIAKIYDGQLDELQKMQAKYKDKDMIEAEELARKDPSKTVEQHLAELHKKREKREKSARIISAVGDGLAALSNLFFTTQYAPNMYNAENSMSASTKAAQDKLKAQRDADRDKYLEYALKIGNLEAGKAKTLRELEAQAEQRRMAREKAQREREAADRQAALHPYALQKAESDAHTAGYKATEAQAQAEAAPEYYAARTEAERARADASRASAAASYATASGSNKTKHHFNGQEYASDRDYKRAVLKEARRRGIAVQEDVPGAIGTAPKKRDRNVDDIAAEVENAIEAEANTPPSRRN